VSEGWEERSDDRMLLQRNNSNLSTRLALRLLASKEGIFGGFSAGANLAAAVKLIKEGRVEEGEGCAFMVCDSGLKYLSTDLYT